MMAAAYNGNLEPSDNCFVADLPAGMSEELLSRVFSIYGTVVDCKILRSNTPNTSAALIRFGSVQEGAWVVSNVNGKIPQGLSAPVIVRYANSNKGMGKGMIGWQKGKGSGKGVQEIKYQLGKTILPGGVRSPNDSNTVFVAGLPWDTTNLDLYHIFSPFGAIAQNGATAQLDKKSGECIGIGFVNYLDAAAANKAISALNGVQVPGCFKPLEVKLKGQQQ
eukprot:TRINITY_DN75616_c0_g1_i1.p1 TRINITY_DN75616_c0_g1~~TRINITY_DN75616_c0_g1_i1.p1  ORF type:complete len:229 (-),score=46.74 TRINITY_DN75616_c0_g1_i1:145-807(-)